MAETASAAAATATAPAVSNGTSNGTSSTTGTTSGGAAAASTGGSGSSSGGGPTSSDGQNRGLPYYEKLRRDLRDTLQKKRLMDKSMVRQFSPLFSSNTDQAPLSDFLVPTGTIRGPNLPLRTDVSRRDLGGEHH